MLAIILSPDARILAAVTSENSTELWNTKTAQLIAKVDGRTFHPALDFKLIDAFSSDSRLFITLSGKQAKIWDPVTGRLRHVISGSQDDLSSACFSPDGKTLATGSKYGTVSLWDTETGLQRFTSTAYQVRKYPKWRIVSRTLQLSTDVEVHFSPDGRRLLTVLFDQPAKLWNATTGQLEAVLGTEVSVAKFTPTGRYVLTTDLERTVLWESESGLKKATFGSWDAQSSPDEQWLGLVKYEGAKGLLNLKTMKVEITLPLINEYFTTWVGFSPNGKIFVLASGLDPHVAAFVDASTGKRIADVPIAAKEGFDFISNYLKYAEALCFHPASTVLMGANRKLVRFWDTGTGQQITQLPEAREPAIFSSDGKLLATASQDKKSILLWEVSVR